MITPLLIFLIECIGIIVVVLLFGLRVIYPTTLFISVMDFIKHFCFHHIYW